MTVKAPPSYTRLAIAIIVATVIVSATIVGSFELQKTTTITLTSISTVTGAGKGAQSSSGVSTTCTIPDSGDLLIRVLNSSNGGPVNSIPIQVENYYPGCFSNDLGTVNTNSSGMVSLGGIGDYNLTVSYDHRSYFANTYIGPGTLTCLTLAIPAGDLDISYSQPGQFNCETSFSSSMIGTTSDLVVYSNVSDGIQLSAVIQPEGQVYGQNYTITAIVRDALTTPVQLNATQLDNPAYGPCAQSFATVNLYDGRYTSANISQAVPLQLYNPSAVYLCPTESLLQYSLNSTNSITETSIISGYWTGSGQNYTHVGIPPGFYTVVVFDAWNQTAIGYLQAYYPAP